MLPADWPYVSHIALVALELQPAIRVCGEGSCIQQLDSAFSVGRTARWACDIFPLAST